MCIYMHNPLSVYQLISAILTLTNMVIYSTIYTFVNKNINGVEKQSCPRPQNYDVGAKLRHRSPNS